MIHHLRAALTGVMLAAVLVVPATAQMAQNTVTLPDGRKLLMTCVGEGGPTVLLDAGLGLPLASWSKTMPELGKIARTCAYNRAGYMGSDPGPMPRDAAHMVDDMKALVTAAGLPGPYVLVAQSLGGHNARLFAARYPQETAGVVLVDPITDEDDLVRAAWAKAGGANDVELAITRCVATRARGETWSETDPAYATCGKPPKLPSPAAEIAMARAVLSEWENKDDGPKQIRDARQAPAKFPIIVLTADGATRGKDAAAAAVHALTLDRHRQIAATSERGEQRTIPGGDHMMQWSKPDVVIAAIHEVVTRYRTGH